MPACFLAPRRLSGTTTATRMPIAWLQASSRNYHIAFFGSDDFSVRVLRNLRKELPPSIIESLTIVAPPDKARGRGLTRSSGPLALYAKDINAELINVPPKTLKGWEPPSTLAADLGVVVSFPYFLPAPLLSRFSHGCVNMHPSLLPKYRGAAPIQYAILNGDTETGVSIIDLDPNRFDAGAILAQETLAIPNPSEIRYPELAATLADFGSRVLATTLRSYDNSKRSALVQDESAASKAPKILKELGIIRWAKDPAQAIWNRWRAFCHQAPLRTSANGHGIQFTELRSPAPIDGPAWPAGTAFYNKRDKELRIVCQDNHFLRVARVKPENRNEMLASDYVNGLKLANLGPTSPVVTFD